MAVDPVVVTLEKVMVKGENLSNVKKTKGKLAVSLHTGENDTKDTMSNIDLDYGAAVAATAIETVARAASERPFWLRGGRRVRR